MAESRHDENRAPASADAFTALTASFGRLEAVARADATVGAPRQVGERTVIPLSEVYYGAGFGLGSGTAPEGSASPRGGVGGGGGFGGRVRPVAVVDVGPTGVRVRPVFDASAIGLAIVTVGLAAVVRLWRRPSRHS